MNVLLISTYDLGRQPFGLASPAAWLAREGLQVDCLDLAVEPYDAPRVARADAICIHVPMHTATRLAVELVPRLREANPGARLAFFGLYAPLNAGLLSDLGASAIVGGEFERELVEWLQSGDAPRLVSFERLPFVVPERGGLPGPERYARLVAADGDELLTGYTEASRGCRHTCRHCPIVPVYAGRFRIVPRDVVLADVERQVESGARHITFGDPDFLNGPKHAETLVRELHRRFPELTYDVTIKVEHLLRHAERLTTLRETGCLFVTSAVESVDDDELRFLAKGHTRADFLHAVERMRDAGLQLNPTFVTFTPWTTRESFAALLELLDRLDLVDAVAPVQYTIRLLITRASRLLELEDVATLVEPFDERRLVYPWSHRDPTLDALQQRVCTTVHEAHHRGDDRRAIFEAVLRAADEALGREPASRESTRPARPTATVPYLTEPWYC
ncbi:MAG: radical SAM protein [bacterium]|nr:radical SAM protein [bacterium]